MSVLRCWVSLQSRNHELLGGWKLAVIRCRSEDDANPHQALQACSNLIWRRNRFQGTGSKVTEPVPKPGTRNRFLNIVSLTHCIICVLYESLFVNNESRNISLKLMRLSFHFFIHSFIHSFIHCIYQQPNITIRAAGRLSTTIKIENNRQIKLCKTRNYQLTHWIATQLNLLINMHALINLVIKKTKRNHCHTLHEENVGLPLSVQAARISSTSMNLRKRK